MKVSDLMKKEVYTVGPDDMVDRIFFLIHYEKIRHIPVVDRGAVVGIVSDRDLYKAIGPRSRNRAVEKDESQLVVVPRKARHIMKRGVITIEPGDDAARAATIMGKRRIGALPVVSKGKLVGIITATDILLAFAKIEAAASKAREQVKAGASAP